MERCQDDFIRIFLLKLLQAFCSKRAAVASGRSEQSAEISSCICLLFTCEELLGLDCHRVIGVVVSCIIILCRELVCTSRCCRELIGSVRHILLTSVELPDKLQSLCVADVFAAIHDSECHLVVTVRRDFSLVRKDPEHSFRNLCLRIFQRGFLLVLSGISLRIYCARAGNCSHHRSE